jgi:hypothetical protein
MNLILAQILRVCQVCPYDYPFYPEILISADEVELMNCTRSKLLYI